MSNPQPTTVQCLKGRLAEFGPRLEFAPAGYIYTGRHCSMGGWRLPRSAWANPFSVKDAGSAQAAVDAYAAWTDRPEQSGLRAQIVTLQGCVLLCWCGDGQPCHARWLAQAARGRSAGPVGECGDSYAGAPVPAPRYRETIRLSDAWAGAL